MHPTAIDNGRLFFGCYLNQDTSKTVVDVGALNVNGYLRIAVRVITCDVVVSSSCVEHVEFFWLMFNEVMRVLKPDGLFYLNAPSNGEFTATRWTAGAFTRSRGRHL